MCISYRLWERKLRVTITQVDVRNCEFLAHRHLTNPLAPMYNRKIVHYSHFDSAKTLTTVRDWLVLRNMLPVYCYAAGKNEANTRLMDPGSAQLRYKLLLCSWIFIRRAIKRQCAKLPTYTVIYFRLNLPSWSSYGWLLDPRALLKHRLDHKDSRCVRKHLDEIYCAYIKHRYFWSAVHIEAVVLLFLL